MLSLLKYPFSASITYSFDTYATGCQVVVFDWYWCTFGKQNPCVIALSVGLYMSSVFVCAGRSAGYWHCWLNNIPSPLPPLSVELPRCFPARSLNRTARSIRIDCPWRAAPLSSQCQPVCDREGEKWRKISAALAVSFPHTSVGRLPADRTFERGGVDSGAAWEEEQSGARRATTTDWPALLRAQRQCKLLDSIQKQRILHINSIV